MKKMKKFASLLLAFAMVLSMGITSFAADTGSITVTNATEGETYSVYKMLDMTYNETTGSYIYTIDSSSEWYGFFTSSDVTSYVSVDQTGVVTWVGGETGTGSIAETFAKLALAYAEANGIEPTATDTATSETVVFEGLEFGYYLIDSSLGALCSLDSTDPDVTVKDKNPTPTVEKEVKEDSTGDYGEKNTADIAETVEFKTEIENASNVSNLVLHDKMSAGLTLVEDSIVVTVGSSQSTEGSTVDSSYYTVTTTNLGDECTFEIAFTDEFTATLSSSQIITVTYKATVNEDAVIGSTGNPNETWVEYGNASESTHDETITYVYDLYIYKYSEKTENGTTTETALAGAKFILYRTVNTTTYYAVMSEVDDGYLITEWTTDETKATEVVSGDDGLIHISGLDAGSYYLEETEAPDGYTLLAAPADIEISQSGVVANTQVVTVASKDYDAIKIKNGSGTEMPSTGGIGTTIFYVVGGILVCGAAVLLIAKKRMRSE